MTDLPQPEPVETTRAFWQDLGLTGLIDVHTHFLPEPLQRKAWAQFVRIFGLIS